MESKPMIVSTLMLRIITLGSLLASIILFATIKVFLITGTKYLFSFYISYRYVMATACIGFAYTLIQIPFAIYHSCTEKRMIRNGCLPEFDFYGDKIVAFLLATGAGAGFALTYELKKSVEGIGGFDDFEKAMNKIYVVVGLLFLGFLCTAVLSVISSINRPNSTNSRWGFK